MSTAFKRVQERYGDSTPVETPYHRAGQVHDDRDGAKLVQARNWRLMAFACASLAALSLGAYIYERQDTRIATYVVPVDRYGRPGRIEAADRVYAPTQAEIGYFVADFVQLVRAKSTDPVVLRQNWVRAYAFVSADAKAGLSQYAREHDPFARVGQEAATVEIVSVLARSPTTYQVQWRETLYDQGVALPPQRWTGLFTVSRKPPRDEAQLRANPLGVFISAFQWSRDL
ncbi:conjugal transfer protein TrbF [Caulobacter rhizosphaerae]|uniref:conjugal transfer protein TrbF n=1 Tax=Caulobacter rhizosphaerae TaxID=2010972 RepID=UPI0013D80090|nr:conjugal transfer protein TrbF [Caulobacter rhizosphaerae]GGL36109.1 conjugal transfer protein TrbF [Caulobacter rhizosphaerae]